MIVRFWGTRGSLPVAATAAAVRRKVASALVAANGRRFADDREAAADFVEQELEFRGGRHLWRRHRLRRDRGRRRGVHHLRHGQRPARIAASTRCGAARQATRATYNFFQSHLHWDHIMGFPFFVPAFDPEAHIVIHAGHADAEAGAAAPAGRDFLPGPVRLAAREDRVRHDRRRARRSRSAALRVARDRAAPFARQLRLPLHRRRAARPSSSAPTASTRSTRWKAKPPSSTSSAMPTW